MAPKPRWKPMAGRESGRLEMFAPNLERRGQLEQLEIFETTEIHKWERHSLGPEDQHEEEWAEAEQGECVGHNGCSSRFGFPGS